MRWFGWLRRKQPAGAFSAIVMQEGSPIGLVGGLIVNSGLTTEEQFAATIEGMRAEFEQPNLRCYTPFYIAIGQRTV